MVTSGTQQALRIGFAVLPQAMVALLGGKEAALVVAALALYCAAAGRVTGLVVGFATMPPARAAEAAKRLAVAIRAAG